MVGTKWFKCDLHLHTPASKCFRDRDSVTAQEWVQEALSKGLQCVAITDHNTGEWIDKIKEAAHGTELVIFPGVELTCSDAKVHILVLFDPEKTKQDIEDFILLSRIERQKFGEQDAHSPLNVEQVIELANEKGALCIPAHIDEYNGISEIANAPREGLLKRDEVLGVQVVHHCLTVPNSQYDKAAKSAALKLVNTYFGVSDEDFEAKKFKITEERLKDWRQSISQSIEWNKAILTFSDNPHAPGDSKHGLQGIGLRYTWIKMDQAPSLESLRQALLLYKFRIKTDFECPNNSKPYETPELWIRRLSVRNTDISNVTTPLEVKFSPQMNTIIGGRGSGKSSILQFIRGLFGKEHELVSLPLVHDEFNRFFKLKDKTGKHGVLRSETEIEVELIRRDELYKLRMTHTNGKLIEIYKYDTNTSDFALMHDNSFLSFFDFDIFSQKQIYEVATNLNSLRERIDDSVESIKEINSNLELKDQEYKQKASEIRTLQLKIQKKPVLLAEIEDIQSRINKYHASGIDTELKKRQAFQKDISIISRFKQEIDSKLAEFDTLADSIIQPNIDILEINEEYQVAIKVAIEDANSQVQDAKKSLLELKASYEQIPKSLITNIGASQWKADNDQSKADFEHKKQQLSDAGVDAVEQIQKDIDLLQSKKSELKDIEQLEKEIKKGLTEKSEIKKEFIDLRTSLTKERKDFLDKLLKNTNVRAKVEECRDFDNLDDLIKSAIGTSAFEDDVKALKNLWSKGNPVKCNEIAFNILNEILDDKYSGKDFGQRFKNKIKALIGEQIDTFDLMFPEDKIKIEYRSGSGHWRQLSNASAGQKTAAILTMILCQGNKPLFLDQPEDDLDNYLIYDLVVEQLRKTKECRQIVCVTHNANIPVNGDSEHIIVMDSETKHIQAKFRGSIEDTDIKKAICDIMEGGTEAFEMRSKRYKKLNYSTAVL